MLYTLLYYIILYYIILYYIILYYIILYYIISNIINIYVTKILNYSTTLLLARITIYEQEFKTN